MFTDAVLRERRDCFFVDESFVVFAADLRDHVDHVTLIGRAAAETNGDGAGIDGTSCAGDPFDRLHRLRSDVDVMTLAPYESLNHPAGVLRSGVTGLGRFWKVLSTVDSAWILGPHPFAIVLAVMAMARGRRVVFGVRQDFPRHQRARHPGRPVIHWAASAMEMVWRALAIRRPVSAVGDQLARHYRFSHPVRNIVVSLIGPDDLIPIESALERSYGGTINLLWVGRLDPVKNPLLLAEILPLLDKVGIDWRLVVCGDGTLRRPLEEALDTAGLSERVEFTGHITLDELHPEYRRAHVLLHTSWTEGVPQVLFEAYAAGVPAVATDVGGVGQSAGGAAILVEPGDAEAVADAVERLVVDPALRAELIKRGHTVAVNHTSTRQLESLVELLQSGR